MQKVIIITGPTSSGKSDLAIRVAKKIGGEIISADSRQVYRGMDIGSGKVPRDGVRTRAATAEPGAFYSGGVRHYCIDVASPRKNFSAARWLACAHRAIRAIRRNKHVPIVAGGTVQYLRALAEGWQLPRVKPDAGLRKRLERMPTDTLFSLLLKRDPRRAKNIDRSNRRRLIRAIEIAATQGFVPRLGKKPQYEFLTFALRVPDVVLARRIRARLRKRIRQGLAREIRALSTVVSLRRIEQFGLEYYWFGKLVAGDIANDEAEEQCRRAILEFSRKQNRWIQVLRPRWVKPHQSILRRVKRWLFAAPQP